MRQCFFFTFLLFFLSCSKPVEHNVRILELHSNWKINHTSIDKIEYSTNFDLDPSFFLHEFIDLESSSLLTNAQIYLNDSLVYLTDNSFGSLKISCKKNLRIKSNQLKVIFESDLNSQEYNIDPIRILAWSKVKLVKVNLQLISVQEKQAQYNAEIITESAKECNIDMDILVQQKDIIKIRDLAVNKGINKQLLSFSIHNPKLWWANGYGNPNFYDVKIRLKLDGKMVQELHNKVSVRKVEQTNSLVFGKQKSGLNLNGIKIKLKGIRFKPPLNYTPDSIERLYKRIIESARMANSNFVFVEKSNFYRRDLFSQLCMENGLLITDTSVFLSKNEFEWLGFPSYPSPETMNICPDPKKENNMGVTLQEKLVMNNLPSILSDSIYSYYNPSLELKQFVYYSQLLQAEKIKSSIEIFRILNTYKCGIIYNQTNDFYSVLSESLQDCMGNWKPAYYSLKNAYSACIVVPIVNKNNVKIYIINDEKKEMDGILLCRMIDFNGKDYFVKQIPVIIKSDSCQNVLTIEIDQLLKNITGNRSCLIVQLNRPGQMEAQNILYFDKPKNLKLSHARIKASVNTTVRSYNLVLKSNVLVKNVFLEVSNQTVVFSDNNFDLLPGKRTKISISFIGTRQELIRSLRINALNPFEIDFK